ncbi:MAG TPA: MFS transporter [Pseudonocardiaceae bacterium]|jgi:MFS family permease|nr:MFS transporter [Pseudonocardiaceae bacterium]
MLTTTAATARPALLTRALLLRFVSTIGASASFFLLLSVVPLYAGASGAGVATGALMFATVAGELVTTPLVARFGYRAMLGAGLVLLGAPALVLTVSTNLVWIATVCVIRGIGFAFTVVAGGALTALIIPAERRGEGLALAGVVSSVPSLIGLPLGVWFVGQVGYTPVAIVGGLVSLAAVVSVIGLPGRVAQHDDTEKPAGLLSGLRDPGLARPAIVFASTALGAGIVVTFLPLAVPSGLASLVAVALFVQPAASTVARWAAGRYGDRHDPAKLILPSLLTCAIGLAATALTGNAVAIIAGVAVFGIGFGVAQNATISLMFARVPRSGYGTVSALWNVGYDGGMGVGAIGFGVLAAWLGYPLAFVASAVLLLGAVLPAVRSRSTRA